MHNRYLSILILFSVVVLCRVCDFIKYGWDMFLVDPDGGANVQNKLTETAVNSRPGDIALLQSIPKVNDSLWTKEIYKAPKVTFSSIYKFLVERKMFFKRLSTSRTP